MTLDPRNGPAWDLPRHHGDARTYVVAATPRTGSTLLCRAMWDTERAGAPKEYLNPMQVRDWEVRLGAPLSRLVHRPLRGPLLALVGRRAWSDARLRRYLDGVRARRTGAGWFGLKIHRHHFEQHFVRPGRSVTAFLGPVTWVRIVREDRHAQAVSWARALQTGRWASTQRAWLPPVYHRAVIARCFEAIARHEAAWDAYFAARAIVPHRVTYEALDADLGEAVGGVLTALGIASVAVAAPSLRRQADATSARWLARFRAEGA